VGVYDAARETAYRLISEKGAAVSLRVDTQASPTDPDKPWKPGALSSVSHSTFAVFLDGVLKDWGSRMGWASMERDTGLRVQGGTVQALMPALNLPVVPTTFDKVVRGARVYNIQSVEAVQPGDDPIIFILELTE
jgi:hypothetical protein